LVVDLGEAAPVGQQSADDAAAHALVLHHRAALVPQGTLIPAVLETPITSSRAGLVRALTSADIRGFDGSRVLIPKGSRLVGDFKADVQQGQTRVLVTWNRLVRPDGVAIKLTSPATDVLGGTGIAGDVNNHFLQRFASVALQTAVTVGTDLAEQSSNASVIVGVPGQTVSSAGQTLFPTTDLKPTIQVKEGASITVFVARDLDFSGAAPRP
jgi:type IV secretion system protein VirB10